MITFKKNLAIFIPATTASPLDNLDVELGVQLGDTLANNNRLIECVTEWQLLSRDTLVCGLEISIITTYQRMPSKVRIALEKDIKDTLKELSSGYVVMKPSRMISKIN